MTENGKQQIREHFIELYENEPKIQYRRPWGEDFFKRNLGGGDFFEKKMGGQDFLLQNLKIPDFIFQKKPFLKIK